MRSFDNNPLYAHGKNPWILLFSLTAITLGGLLFIGTVLTLVSALIIYGNEFSMLAEILKDPMDFPDERFNFLILQGVVSISGFIIAPLIFYYALVKGNFINDFIRLPKKSWNILLTTFLITFSFMVVNTVFIEWNVNVKLPEIFSGFENWAKNQEDQRMIVTEYMTRFDSPGYFLFAIVVIAIIPGIGEELLFRGFLQNILKRITHNDHIAVWIAAILFSAIHFQFYGFIPRMLLGALFGYLYLWSGNLLVPMAAHFINNSVSLFALYVYQKGLTDIDVESTDALPTMYVIIFSILFVVTLIYFKNYLAKSNINEKLGHRL